MSRRNIKMGEFSILMPPPNVSGKLHIGHALGFFLQDCLCGLASLLVGKKNVYLLPGLDHGGISTQYSGLKEQAHNEQLLLLAQNGASQEELENYKYKIIYDFAEQAKNDIIYQMKSFNIMADFNELKYTMDKEHVLLVNETFITLYNRGLIYEEERIVYWDSHFKTSLSTLEVTYKSQEDKLFYIHYKLDGEEEYVKVATTRPETIFGDVALVVGQKNRHLAGKKVIIPLINKIIPILFDDKVVVDDFGSGILKITPAHDEKDFNTAKKHKLPIVNILDKDLLMNDNVPLKYRGITPIVCRHKVVEELVNNYLLEKEETITHNVMFGEKSGKQIETIVKKQWYLDLSKAANKSLELLEEGKWNIFPNYWINTYRHWIKNLQPWCISREIVWGHKIPLWRREDGSIITAVSQEEAEKQSNNQPIVRDNFVLDTWFSSALWPLLYDKYPTTLLVTGHDILFFWVARMMMMSIELKNQLPFTQVLLHDLVRDGKGEKMSKTKGNVANPLELIHEYGSDIVRYALLSKISIRGKIRFSLQDINNGQKLQTKIENAIRFLQLYYTIEHFNEVVHMMVLTNPIVIFFIQQLEKIHPMDLFENYNVDSYLNSVYGYFWHEYCDWFVELSKKQLYNREFQFAHMYIIKKILCYFYGFFPQLVNSIFKDRFNSEVMLPKVDIIYNPSSPIDSVGDFMFIVNQIRHLQANNIGVYIKTPLFNYDGEELLWQALKIPLYCSNGQEFKKILMRNREIYIIHNEKVPQCFMKSIGKKSKEMEIINQKLLEDLPPNLISKFSHQVKALGEEIAILENYLLQCV